MKIVCFAFSVSVCASAFAEAELDTRQTADSGKPSTPSTTSVALGPVGPRLVFVDDGAPLGGDGESWATAYRFLQDGLQDASTTGAAVEVRVAGGLYKPDEDEGGNVTIGDQAASLVLVSELSLLGGYAGFGAVDPDERDIEQFETILSGDLLGNDVGTNGREDNSFQVVDGSAGNSTTLLDGCTIMRGAAPFFGGGLRTGRGVMIRRCTFTLNTANDSGGAVIASQNTTFIDCEFADNKAFGGGAIAPGEATFFGSFRVQNSRFRRNVATGGDGGALAAGSSSIVVGSLFERNQANDDGGAVYLFMSNIFQCTFVENHATDSGGGVVADNVSNCIFFGNTDNGGSNGLQSAHLISGNLSHSIILGGWNGPGTGNWDADPMFVDPENGDYRLLPGSPAIDLGSNGLRRSDAFDLNTNGDTVEPIPFDLDGAARTVGCRIDAGAFEFQGDAQLYGDIDDDCDTDLDDYELMEICMLLSGPNITPPFAECLSAFDSDTDMDVDLRDFQRFAVFFSPTPDPL